MLYEQVGLTADAVAAAARESLAAVEAPPRDTTLQSEGFVKGTVRPRWWGHRRVAESRPSKAMPRDMIVR